MPFRFVFAVFLRRAERRLFVVAMFRLKWLHYRGNHLDIEGTY
jgi:hypothetical protein